MSANADAELALANATEAAVPRRTGAPWWPSLILLFVLVAGLEAFARSGHAPNYVVAPTVIGRAIVDLFVSGDIWGHLGASLYRVTLGFAGGAAAGVLIGLLAGRLKLVEIYFDPLISLTYPVPKTALLPIFMAWFGIGDASKIAIIMLSAFYPTFINSYYGARSVSANLLRAADNMGASPWRKFWRVVAPASLPQIFAGLRVALAFSFIVLFVAEIIGAHAGLGYLISLAGDNLRFDLMYAALTCFGLVGFLADRLLLAVRRRALIGQAEDERR